MDLSKLPKLSQSPAPPPTEQDVATTATPAPPAPQHAAPFVVGAEAWFSAIIGLVFIFMGMNFAKYAACVVTGRTYHTNVTWQEGTPHAGEEVPYPQLNASLGLPFWSESGMFAFGVALLAEAAVLVAASYTRHRRHVMMIGIAIAIFSTAYNGVVAGILYNAGITPLISLLAVAFGGYGAFYLAGVRRSMIPI